MAVTVDTDTMDDGQGDFEKETQYIEQGTHPARCVYYAELGKHYPIFKGKRATYDSGKNSGKLKPAELMIHLVFEFPNCPYDNMPLTIKTSIPFGDNGEFINKLPVSDALASGKISKSFANRSKYMKFLNSMNAALGTDYKGLHEFIGEGFLIAVTNKTGKKADDDGNLPVYANMKPDGIQKTTFKHPATGKMEEVPVPEAKGNYGEMFDWDNPTKEAWDAMPEYLQKCIKSALNYEGSEVQMMVEDLYGAEPEEQPAPPQDNNGRPASAEIPPPDDDVPF